MVVTSSTCRLRTCTAAMLFIMSVVPAAAGDSASEAPAGQSEIRAAIARSVPYIQEHGASWIEDRGCVSCHRVGMMTWSLREAADHGFDVDRVQLSEWTDWSLAALAEVDEQRGEPIGTRNPEGMSQLLLNQQTVSDTPERQQAYQVLVDILLAGQSKDGTWKPGGQLPQQKRANKETRQVSTMWNTLALMQVTPASAETTNSIQLATRRITTADPGESTEWYVTRLLFALKHPKPDTSASWLDQLKSHQQTDGGWGWLVEEPADALATGMALYAMRQAGVGDDDPAVQAAQTFLLQTQQEDGSWAVHGTKESKRESLEETAGFWGTTWATIALLQALPAPDSP